jgi:dual specificity phosphatase 12
MLYEPVKGHDGCSHILANVITTELQGKIKCPKCDAKIGSYNMAGMQCSCEEFVGPFYGFSKSKVDITASQPRA